MFFNCCYSRTKARCQRTEATEECLKFKPAESMLVRVGYKFIHTLVISPVLNFTKRTLLEDISFVVRETKVIYYFSPLMVTSFLNFN